VDGIRRWLIACTACGAVVTHAARAGEASNPDAPTPRPWQLWTAAQLLVSAPVGAYQPATDPSPPGLGLTALLRSPRGGWSARAGVDVSRYRTSGNVTLSTRFGSFSAPTTSATDVIWALAGAQWEATSITAAPHVHVVAGIASARTRIETISAVRTNDMPFLQDDRTLFATGVGGGIRWPIGTGGRFGLTLDADYRWTAPVSYLTSPVIDSTGIHYVSRRSSIEAVTGQIGLAARWGGP